MLAKSQAEWKWQHKGSDPFPETKKKHGTTKQESVPAETQAARTP